VAHLHELTVRGAEHEYPVIVGPGVLSAALPDLVARGRFSRVAIVTNTRLAPLYGLALADRLPGACLITLPDGEQYKTMDSLARLYGELLAAGVDRSGLVIALGGGVIGDLAGFAAATFMRGVALIQAPTSLLAMVDASIGGKVGVDLPQGKNLAGAFKDPLAVFADTDTLATLPPVERRCGLAEVVKSALIADPALLEELSADPLPPDDTIITRTARVKIALVNQDRTEQGVRAFLNLGHTFAHAIEQVSGYAWKHGEAVAVGLIDLEGSRTDGILGAAEIAGLRRYRVVQLDDYFGTAMEVQPDYMATIKHLAETAAPDTIFLLDSRIPLPGMMESSELEEHMMRLRNIAPASWERTSERELPNTGLDGVIPTATPLSTKGGR